MNQVVDQLARQIDLVASIRDLVASETSERRVADAVGRLLETTRLDDLLTDQQRLGDPTKLAHHLVHAEDDGSFSIVAIVWLPGQATVIHDHLCWCVVAVIEGEESETVYRLECRGRRVAVAPVETRANSAGTVTVLSPPGDIHKVENVRSAQTISLHVYGANISSLATSIRRSYPEPMA